MASASSVSVAARSAPCSVLCESHEEDRRDLGKRPVLVIRSWSADFVHRSPTADPRLFGASPWTSRSKSAESMTRALDAGVQDTCRAARSAASVGSPAGRGWRAGLGAVGGQRCHGSGLSDAPRHATRASCTRVGLTHATWRLRQWSRRPGRHEALGPAAVGANGQGARAW